MKHILLLSLLAAASSLAAQTTNGLIAYYPFDGTLTDVTGNSANTGIPSGDVLFLCGVDETALAFNGATDQVNIAGPLTEEFNVENFSLSFHFKSTGDAGTQYLLSKRRTDCAGDFAFFIRYRAATRTLNAVFAETPNKSVSLIHQLPDDRCWFHVALVRDENRIKLFIDGQSVQEGVTVGRINIENDGDLIIGNTDCLGPNEAPFDGLMDELRFYDRVLGVDEIRNLNFRPDKIQTPDTLIFLGNTLDIELTNTCATEFRWSPMEGLSDPNSPEPTVTGLTPGVITYTLEMTHDLTGCTALDSISINVIDPDDLDCRSIFLPTAFTPNNDELNDTYGISNPFALQELLSFEIFDRWGGRVFFTTDPFERWDGSVNGTPLNSGVLLYKIVYRCQEEELVKTGSVTIMR